MKYRILLFLLFAVFSISALPAQEDSYRPLKKSTIPWERLYTGGNVGGALSEFSAFAELSPLLGYRLTDAFSLGSGFTFQYFNYKYYDSKNFFYGPRLFARFQLFRFLFAYSEYEHLFLKYYSAGNPNGEKASSPNLYIGGGLSSGFENGTGSFVMVLYNLNDNLNNPFPNPSFRFGFTIGLGGR